MSLKYRTSAGTSASDFTDLVVKVGDTLPIGTEVDYDGQTAPAGWQEVSETKLGDVVVDSIRTKNMFDLTPVVNGTSHIIYYPVKVKTNTKYTVSTNDSGADPTVANVFFLTTNSGASSASNGVWPDRPRTINSGSLTKLYIGIRGFNTSTSWVQMEEGDSATPYTPYQELNSKEAYSLNEERIGTWIDGKPLYRKVVYISSLPNNTMTKYQVFNDKSIIDTCFIDSSGSYMKIAQEVDTLNWIYSTTGFIMTCLLDKEIRIKTTDDKSTAHAYIAVCYTKTTD